MKKRILIIAICIILTISALCLPAYATPSATDLRNVSEDYTEVFYNGKTYIKIDPYHYIDNCDYPIRITMPLSDTQQKEISSIVATERGVFLALDISFIKGGYVTYYYICEDYAADYQNFLDRGGNMFEGFDPYWGIDFKVNSSEFLTDPVTVKGYEVDYYETFLSIYSYDESTSRSFKKLSGMIITDGHNNFYYLDHYQFGADAAKNFDATEHDTVKLYKITNATILDQLIQDDGYIEIDDEGVFWVFAVFTGIVFAALLVVLPLTVLIIALILSRKAKQPYKRLLRALALLLTIEIMVFVLTAIAVICLIVI